MSHGLSEQTVAEIRAILASFPQVERAILFGSRAKGCARIGSDVDLTLAGAHIHRSDLTRIENAFDDSMLPYRFSLSALTMLRDPEFLAHIERVGIPFYVRDEPDA